MNFYFRKWFEEDFSAINYKVVGKQINGVLTFEELEVISENYDVEYDDQCIKIKLIDANKRTRVYTFLLEDLEQTILKT